MKYSNRPKIYFTKDDEGNLIAHEVTDEDVAVSSKKDIRILVLGHIDYINKRILDVLTRAEINERVLLVGSLEDVKVIDHQGLNPMEEHLKEMSRIPMIIESIDIDIQEIFLEKEKKSYTKHTVRFVPKTQKSKSIQRRFLRKK